jgi:hypothetical protein
LRGRGAVMNEHRKALEEGDGFEDQLLGEKPTTPEL